jgi:cysteinyl-tRNA synthetase
MLASVRRLDDLGKDAGEDRRAARRRVDRVLSLYDTRTRRVEEIVPATPGALAMYCCGPTVYRFAHVGNLRTFLLGDLIRRTAIHHNLRVTVVQNITDVGHMADDSDLDPTGEDKVLAEARRQGKGPLEIARFYEEAFHQDLAALNVHPANEYPRATESIELILELISTLVDRGHAYVGGDGSVFFDARSFPSYGEVSGNRLDQLKPGHRFEGTVDEAKRFHADWALWKKASSMRRNMTWESPWGPGFPGWHIECSAMSLHYLGDDIDVHTGGIDLRFPHHEDERAQSNAAAGHDVVRHWVHGEHLLFEGRKMAKSSGNVVLLSDVVERGLDPLALRLAFLESRHRTQMNLTWDAIEAADALLGRWRRRVADWAEAPSKPMCAEYVEQVVAAFDDDLDTATALQVLRRVEKDSEVVPGSKFEMFAHLDALFGLDLAREVGQARPVAALPAGAQELLERRAAARSAKDWAESDRLREELGGLGVAVTDTPQGQEWNAAPL